MISSASVFSFRHLAMKTMNFSPSLRGLTSFEVGGLLAAAALLAGLAMPRSMGNHGQPAWSETAAGTVRSVSVAHDAWEPAAGRIGVAAVHPAARRTLAPAGIPAVSSYGDADLSKTGPAAAMGSASFDAVWTDAPSGMTGDREGRNRFPTSRGSSMPEGSESSGFRKLTAGGRTLSARDSAGPR
jgi:hypothetical protein